MMFRYAFSTVLCIACHAMTEPARAAPLAPRAEGVVAGAAQSSVRVDYRPYYHCHGPKRCHGKGNYYTYTPSRSYEPFTYGCRYGCGYNNGWNSPSSRFDYIGRRYGSHRRHRH